MKASATVSEGADKRELHEAERLAALEGESRTKLQSLLDFVRTGAQSSELHEVERQVLVQLLGLGRTLLEPMFNEAASACIGVLLQAAERSHPGEALLSQDLADRHETKERLLDLAAGRVRAPRSG